DGNGLAEGVGRPEAEAARPAEVDGVGQFDPGADAEAVAEGEDAAEQIGVAGPLADAVDAGIDPGVLAGVEVAEGAANGVGDGHAEVVVAVGLDRQVDLGGKAGEALADVGRGLAPGGGGGGGPGGGRVCG